MSAFPPHAGMGLRHGIRKDNRQKTGNQYDNDGNPQDYALPDIFNQIKNGMTPTQTANEFAKENGYTTGVEYLGRWKSFAAYIIKQDYESESDVGLPTFILVKNSVARFANSESRMAIIAHFND